MNTQSLTPSIFHFGQNQLRSLVLDQQPWFVAKDLCDILGLTNSRKAITGLDPDEKRMYGIAAPGVTNGDTSPAHVGASVPPMFKELGNILNQLEKGAQKPAQRRNMQIVSQSGMYALVFKSRKPEAKLFRKWVTSEVLPALFSTGTYSRPSAAAASKAQPAPAPKALPTGLPAGVLDARSIPAVTVGLLGGKVRMVSVEGKQWYCAADVLTVMGAYRGNAGKVLRAMTHEHRARVRLFNANSSSWFLDETGIRLIMGTRGLLTSQLTLNLAH